MPASERDRHILVIGEGAYPREVTAKPWSGVADVNVADFDVAIVDFTTFPTQRGNTPATVALPTVNQFASLMFAGETEIIAIGPPGAGKQAPSYWLPVFAAVVEERGQSVNVVEEEFASYFALVKRTAFFFYDAPYERNTGEVGAFAAHAAGGDVIRAEMHPVAKSKAGKPIAIRLQYTVGTTKQRPERALIYDPRGESRPFQLLAVSGWVYWLPAPTEATTTEAITHLLHVRYGISDATPPPEWIGKYSVPAEVPIRAEVAGLKAQIEELEQKHANASARLEEAGRFKGLLYEKGARLEGLVWNALRQLGATVTEPLARVGNDDGRIAIPMNGREGVLEIKGAVGGVTREHVRQTHQWVSDVLAEEDRDAKGILVVNPFCEIDPEQRIFTIAQNVVTLAVRWGICIITTSQLFDAICRHSVGGLKGEAFWEAVWVSAGPLTLGDVGTIAGTIGE